MLDKRFYGMVASAATKATIPADQWLAFLASDPAVPEMLVAYRKENERLGKPLADSDGLIQGVANWRAAHKCPEIPKPTVKEKPVTDVQKLTQKLSELRDTHREFTELLMEIRDKAAMLDAIHVNPAMPYTLPECVDIGFLCRETEELLDEWRKEAKSRKELCGKVIAISVTEQSLTNPSMEETIQGTLASGTPDVKVEASIPKAGTPEYFAVMEHLGVPQAVVETGLVKPSFEEVGKYLTRLKENGQELPPCLSKTWTTFATKYLRKRGK